MQYYTAEQLKRMACWAMRKNLKREYELLEYLEELEAVCSDSMLDRIWALHAIRCELVAWREKLYPVFLMLTPDNYDGGAKLSKTQVIALRAIISHMVDKHIKKAKEIIR